MFNTDLNIEEEILLEQILDNKDLNRVEVLHQINAICTNTNNEEIGIQNAKSLFEKIKCTSDYEYSEYVKLLLKK